MHATEYLNRICVLFCNCLVPVWILSYQESTVAAHISSLYIYNICLLACKTDSFLKSTHS